MEKVVIIGCNGFIGQYLTKFLLEKGVFVYGFDLKVNNKIQNNRFLFFNFDSLSNIDANLFNNIDVLYHLSWSGVSTVDKNDYKKQFINFELTYKVLLFAKRISVKKIIIPGSTSEFSKYKFPITGYEQDAPADLYAATKVAIRKIAFQFCESNNLDLNWLLITSIYGKGRNDANLLTYVISNLKENKIVDTTKLEQKWDYLHIDDLMNAFYLIGIKGKQNIIYPVGSGVSKELKDFVLEIGRIMNKTNLIHIGTIPYKNSYIDNSIVDITELKELGYSNTKNFSEEINKIIKGY